MKPLNLARLAPFNSPPVPCATSTNPGCTDPASQSFAPAPADRAGSRTPCSSPTITSNGEMQRGNQHLGNISSGTVTVSAGSGAVVQAFGEGGQLLDMKAIELAVSTGRGLPKNVNAGHENHARFIPPAPAIGIPPAIDVAAGTSHPGGLPTNINIR